MGWICLPVGLELFGRGTLNLQNSSVSVHNVHLLRRHDAILLGQMGRKLVFLVVLLEASVTPAAESVVPLFKDPLRKDIDRERETKLIREREIRKERKRRLENMRLEKRR